ncbi:MAG: VOC family protein [Planctomycetota bacterium]
MTLRLTHDIVDAGIVCSDFERSLAFYRDILGLAVHVDVQIPDRVAQGVGLAPTGFRQVRLRAGKTLIKLMEIKNPPEPRPEGFTNGVRWLTFFVEDVRGLYRDLTAKGVRFTGPPIVPEKGKGLVCAIDPDGILIELVEL